MNTWTDLNAMLNSREWQNFESDKLGNNLCIEDPERFDRINAAAEEGFDGSTHREHIEDWRDFLDNGGLRIFDTEYNDPQEDMNKYDLTDKNIEALKAEIDECELRHIQHGTIDKQVG
jgi:hypothetical protein